MMLIQINNLMKSFNWSNLLIDSSTHLFAEHLLDARQRTDVISYLTWTQI